MCCKVRSTSFSIFPIMMVAMMAWRPMKALMSVNAAFKSLEVHLRQFAFYPNIAYSEAIQSENVGTLILHKMLYVLGHLCAIALAVYKCHSMGLLPNHA